MLKPLPLIALMFLCLLMGNTAQTVPDKTDSLRKLLVERKDDITSVSIARQLGEQWRGKQSDSALKYFQKAAAIINTLPDDSTKQALSGDINISLASFYMELSHLDQTWYYDSLALAIAAKSGSTKIFAQGYNIKGLVYYQTGDYDSAIYFYRSALKFARQVNDEELTSKIYTNLGIIKFLQGDGDSALICFEKPLQIATELQNKELQAGSYYNLGMLKYHLGEIDAAEEYYFISKKLYDEIQNYTGLILTLNSLGNIFQTKAEYEKALDNYLQIIKINQRLNDKLNLARAYHNIAAVFAHIGDEFNATENYLLSIKIKEEEGDKKGIGTDYVGLGILNTNKGNNIQALEYYNKALSIYKSLNYQSGIGTALGSIASTYFNLHKPDTAIKVYYQAIRIFETLDNPQGLSDNYLSLAIALEAKLEYSTVMDYYAKAIAIKIEIEDNENLGVAYYNLAKYHNSLAKNTASAESEKLYLKALDYGQQADKIAIDYGLISLRIASTEVLTQTYKAIGQTGKALKYAEIHSQASDSLFSLSKTDAATFAEARWQSQKKQQEILRLHKDKLLQQEILVRKEIESKQKNILITSLATIIAAILIIGFLIYFYVKKQRDLLYQQQLNQITKLRFENIRNRLSPHFLFNALGSITVSLDYNPEIKDKLNVILRMLRQSLENIEKPEISLEGEVGFVKDYIEIQRNNYSRNVEVIWNIDEILLQREIPVMAIQIPVENALKHGLALKQEGENILRISAQKQTDSIVIAISDNGVGRDNTRQPATTHRTGTGINVMSQTMHILNRNNSRPITWQITDTKDTAGKNTGTLVEIVIPDNFKFQL